MGQLRTSRRDFLALCGAIAGAAMLPTEMRILAMQAYAASAFQFTPHERAVLLAATNALAPGSDITNVPINTRLGPKMIPSAGNGGAVDYIELLLQGSKLFAAGTTRPPYVKLPNGTVAKPFPSAGATPLWAVKKMGWFGDNVSRPTRPYRWPSELGRLQQIYHAGVKALDAAAFPTTSNLANLPVQTAILSAMYAQEVNQYNANPQSNDPRQGAEGNQPFLLTLLDHVVEASFGDPIYGGNKNYVYWDMINFTGPSYIDGGGPSPGQGWSWKDMRAPFDRRKTVTRQ